MATAVPVAVVSNRLVEQPFNRLRRLVGSTGARHDPYADRPEPVPAAPLANPVLLTR